MDLSCRGDVSLRQVYWSVGTLCHHSTLSSRLFCKKVLPKHRICFWNNILEPLYVDLVQHDLFRWPLLDNLQPLLKIDLQDLQGICFSPCYRDSFGATLLLISTSPLDWCLGRCYVIGTWNYLTICDWELICTIDYLQTMQEWRGQESQAHYYDENDSTIAPICYSYCSRINLLISRAWINNFYHKHCSGCNQHSQCTCEAARTTSMANN